MTPIESNRDLLASLNRDAFLGRVVHTGFIHCSASDRMGHDDVSVIRSWHLERGFRDVGYHFFIRKDGTIQHGRSLSAVPAAQQGHNVGTVAICLSGEYEFQPEQFDALRALVARLDTVCDGLRWRPHNEVSPKSCPNFDVDKVLQLGPDGRRGYYPDTIPAPPPTEPAPPLGCAEVIAQLEQQAADLRAHASELDRAARKLRSLEARGAK